MESDVHPVCQGCAEKAVHLRKDNLDDISDGSDGAKLAPGTEPWQNTLPTSDGLFYVE